MSKAPFSPSADRNKQPILNVLRQVLPESGTALEVASGTGQHATWFAAALPGWVWQPSEATEIGVQCITACLAEAGLSNVRAPLQLDVMAPGWASSSPTDDPTLAQTYGAPFNAVFCANMLHISPWATCPALMQGAARRLAPTGQLILYGPFLEDDVPTADGNRAFDESLRSQHPAWGLRRKTDVEHEAQRAGLTLRERYTMPANNLILVFARPT